MRVGCRFFGVRKFGADIGLGVGGWGLGITWCGVVWCGMLWCGVVVVSRREKAGR